MKFLSFDVSDLNVLCLVIRVVWGSLGAGVKMIKRWLAARFGGDGGDGHKALAVDDDDCQRRAWGF